MASIRIAAVVLAAIAHVFVFAQVWAIVGAKVSFAALGAGGSFYISAPIAAVVTAALTSAPIALLLGWLTGRRFITLAAVLIPLFWLCANIYWRGLPSTFELPGAYSVGTELLAIVVLSSAFFFVGSSARLRRAGA